MNVESISKQCSVSKVKPEPTHLEQMVNCMRFWLAFLKSCGSTLKSGHSPVTFRLYDLDTWMMAKPLPTAEIST